LKKVEKRWYRACVTFHIFINVNENKNENKRERNKEKENEKVKWVNYSLSFTGDSNYMQNL